MRVGIDLGQEAARSAPVAHIEYQRQPIIFRRSGMYAQCIPRVTVGESDQLFHLSLNIIEGFDMLITPTYVGEED